MAESVSPKRHDACTSRPVEHTPRPPYFAGLVWPTSVLLCIKLHLHRSAPHCWTHLRTLPWHHSRSARRRTARSDSETKHGGRQCTHHRMAYKSHLDDSCRIGEAKVPGPLTTYWQQRHFQIMHMKGDGQCLYHAIGYHVSRKAHEVRAELLQHLGDQPRLFADMDTHGTISEEVVVQLRNPHTWGGALQISIAASKWNVTIHVHSTELPTILWGGPHRMASRIPLRAGRVTQSRPL